MKSKSQIKEIRIYYESIEQAANYIKPIIEKSLKKIGSNIKVNLIKLIGSYSYYSKNVAPIIFWKDPDILITLVIEEIEYPVLLIEFSNAVFTEDHELQRFDGLVAAAENDCIYVKISPINKQSRNQHGGNVDFDYIGPFSLIYKKFGKMFYHFDWKCDKDGIVLVDKEYLSCPRGITEFDEFIEILMQFIEASEFKGGGWLNKLEKRIVQNKFFEEWKNKLKEFKLPDIRALDSTRTEWINTKKEFILKLNRFGHAMDPERGMLAYYGTLYEKTVSKMLFNKENSAWYKDTPKETEIKDYIKSSGLKEGYDFLYCFLLGSGLYNNEDFKEIVSNLKDKKEDPLEIEITGFLSKNYLSLNKAMRTIFKNSTYFYIVDENNNIKVKFTWKQLDKDEDYSTLQHVTKVESRTNLDEDDVTYITIHNILNKNGYRIIAVSYPGAQADRVVLVAPGTGRTQERRYVDIISYLPKKYTNLQENKGKYSPAPIQNEINELSKYKVDNDYKNAINSFIDRFDKSAPKTIKIGVGFWANARFSLDKLKELDIKDLDYFVYITPDRSEWFIWNTGKGDMFKVTKGRVDIPNTFEVIKGQTNKDEQPLEKFF